MGARQRVVAARDVVLSFGQTPALRGATMSAAAGEILAVMGPSGSGKSTLLHCLAGILLPASGEVHFAGRRVDTMGETERSALRRDRFGFVFQFGQLVPELTAVENVALPLLLGGARRAAALTAARPWFERLGLDGLEGRRSGELSGGQAQRVALESAAPAAVVATGTGFLAAHLFLTAQMDYSLHAPGVAYYVIVVAGLAASLGIIASTLPLLRRITGPETARNE